MVFFLSALATTICLSRNKNGVLRYNYICFQHWCANGISVNYSGFLFCLSLLIYIAGRVREREGMREPQANSTLLGQNLMWGSHSVVRRFANSPTQVPLRISEHLWLVTCQKGLLWPWRNSLVAVAVSSCCVSSQLQNLRQVTMAHCAFVSSSIISTMQGCGENTL